MSTHDDAGHLSLDELADLLAGEGSQAAVSHVETCVRCAGQLGALDDAQAPVTAALRRLPVPPVPADLGPRLDAAFAAAGPPELAQRRVPGGPPPTDDAAERPAGSPAAPPAAPAVAPTATVTPLPRRRATPSWLPGAAAAVLVLAAGVFGLSQLGGGGDDAETASAPAGGAVSDGAGSTAADALAGVAVNASGRDYGTDPAALAQALPAVLAGDAGPRTAAARPPGAASAPAPAAPLSTPGLERLRDPAGLASCLSALLPPGDEAVRPLALDYAAYDGQPALVVVLPATEPTKVDVFVVGAGCAASNDATLFFTRLDRPA